VNVLRSQRGQSRAVLAGLGVLVFFDESPNRLR